MNFLAKPRPFAVLSIVVRKKFCAMQSKNIQKISSDTIYASTARHSSRHNHGIKTLACASRSALTLIKYLINTIKQALPFSS